MPPTLFPLFDFIQVDQQSRYILTFALVYAMLVPQLPYLVTHPSIRRSVSPLGFHLLLLIMYPK